jgi:hypothetical protein
MAETQVFCHGKRPLEARSMKMSILKFGCSILLTALTVLAPATFSYASGPVGGDVLVTQVSANEMYGYLPKEKLSFLIQSGWDIYAGPTENGETYGKRMTKIEFYLGEKSLLVQAGRQLYIKGQHRPGLMTDQRRKSLLRNALKTTVRSNWVSTPISS